MLRSSEIRKKFVERKLNGIFSFSSDHLMKTVAASEKEYLAFGSELRLIYERAAEVSKTAASLVSLTKGERVNALTKELKEFLDRNRDLGADSGQGTKALATILDKASRIENHLQSFRNMVRTLQVLSNFIKIESIRFDEGKNGFHALAEDVGILARNIEAKSSPVMAQSNGLIMLVNENLARVLSFERSGRDKGKIIAKDIMAGIGALNERRQTSSQRLIRIKAVWEEITKSIGEIVSSLQFHDITRQRIEHVAEALKISSEGDGMEETYKTYELQKAQLQHTKEELVSATERICKELRTLAGRIGEMSREAKGVMEDDQGTGASFFSELEKAVAELTEAVNEHAEINKEMASTTEQVSSAVSQMEGFLQEIVKIGIEMKMIALNAAIHAAHVGEQGLALGVLSEQIHALSQGTSGRITSIGEDLHCIFDHASNLKNSTALVSRRRAEEELHMVEELKRMLPLLQELHAEAISVLKRIEAEGDALSVETGKKADSLHFHEQILQGIESLSSEVEKEWMKIGKDPARKGRRSIRSGEIGGMRDLEKNYTMQREREVHQTMLGIRDQKERSSSPSSELNQEKNRENEDVEELGENVELF